MQSVENILRHLRPNPQFYGSLIGSNQTVYDALNWVDSRTKPTWQEILDAEEPYLALKAQVDAPAQIKALTHRIILELAPEWKQRNMLAKALQIENLQRNNESTPEQDAEVDLILVAWGKIERIRAKSDELEATYIARATALTPEDLATIRATLEAA